MVQRRLLAPVDCGGDGALFEEDEQLPPAGHDRLLRLAPAARVGVNRKNASSSALRTQAYVPSVGVGEIGPPAGDASARLSSSRRAGAKALSPASTT